jgi:hypothetical protein
MNNQSLVRYGGIAAIVSAVLYILSIGLWMAAGTAGSPPLAMAAYVGSQLVFLVTLYALYLIHRDEAPTAILIGALVLAVAIVVSFFIDPTDMDNPVVLLLTIGYGVGALILGWLAYGSPRLTKGIGIAALLTGGLSLVMVPFILAGSSDLVGLLNLVLSVPYLVWLVWLGWHFVKGKATSLQAA